MKKKTIQMFAVALTIMAFIIGLHQYVTWGYWFEFKDIHHETFIVAFLCAGVSTYLISNSVWGKKKHG